MPVAKGEERSGEERRGGEGRGEQDVRKTTGVKLSDSAAIWVCGGDVSCGGQGHGSRMRVEGGKERGGVSIWFQTLRAGRT